MIGFYITHPQVKIDAQVPVPKWGLSDIGAARARQAAQSNWAKQLRRIVSSDETKAIETARILAQSADIRIEIVEGMHENDRSATGFLPPPEFEAAADRFFAESEKSFKGWERAIDAQRRIVSSALSILADHDPTQPIAFVGHGGVGTLLKCHLKNIAISRAEDQLNGGGNLYSFTLADHTLSCDWTPIERFEGWP